MTDVRETGLSVFRELLPGSPPRWRRRRPPARRIRRRIPRDRPRQRLRSIVGARRPQPARPQPRHTWACSSRCRSTDELALHFKIARTNGLTDDEIAEVIYHSSGYAGFPAAATATDRRGGAGRVRQPAVARGLTSVREMPVKCGVSPADTHARGKVGGKERVEPPRRIEPLTCSLRVSRSTD